MRNLNVKESECIANYLMDLEQNEEVRCFLTEDFVIMEKYGITGIFGLSDEIEHIAYSYNVNFDFCAVCLDIEDLLETLCRYSVKNREYWNIEKIGEVNSYEW